MRRFVVTLVEILSSLFPEGHAVRVNDGLIFGEGSIQAGHDIYVIGVDGRTAVGVDQAIQLSGKVLEAYQSGRYQALLVLVDSDSQRMSRRDEMLGIHEFLAHLAKCLLTVDALGLPTIGLLYGYTAAGAFIATALATRALLALPGAEPSVMDLPSMSRVTKLPIAVLQEKAATTPVFAPGLENLSQTGAVSIELDPGQSLRDQWLAAVVQYAQSDVLKDPRDELGYARKGRPKAMEIAERVRSLAHASQH
jgi:malonate decarboxylase gamma subunit